MLGGYKDSDNSRHNHKDIVRSRQNQGMGLLSGLCIPILNMRYRVPHGNVGDNGCFESDRGRLRVTQFVFLSRVT